MVHFIPLFGTLDEPSMFSPLTRVPQLCLTYLSRVFDGVLQLKDGVATQEELDSIKKSVTESYEKDFEVLRCYLPVLLLMC